MKNREQQEINAYKLRLRQVTVCDLELLRTWRNSSEIRKNMLSQSIISTAEQKKWFQKISIQQKNQQAFHFVVEYKDKPVGYANFNYENRQTGLYIGEEKYRGTILAFCLALALLDFVFFQLCEKELEAIVLSQNQAAIRFNKKLGYQIVSEIEDIVTMHLTKERYLQGKNELKKIIRI